MDRYDRGNIQLQSLHLIIKASIRRRCCCRLRHMGIQQVRFNHQLFLRQELHVVAVGVVEADVVLLELGAAEL